MSKNEWGLRQTAATLFALVLSLIALDALQELVPVLRHEAELSQCRQVSRGDREVECIFKAVEEELRFHSVSSAMGLFSRAYQRSSSFLAVGCHRQAHRVGDLTYYEKYLAGAADLDAIDLPQSTTACGYGFYHGFIEHFIQDNPDPRFVTKTCEYLQERLGGVMADIRLTCYHGSGHGFMLAQSERVPKGLWGSVKAFTAYPVEQCEKLEKAKPDEIEQCREGIFNVLVDWMELGENGFSMDDRDVFRVCNSVPSMSHKACYYEMAQKLDGLAKHDPRQIYALVARIPSEEMRELSFQVGVAGVIQNVIGESDGYTKALEQCAGLPAQDYYKKCLLSIVHGLFEHGEPQREYVKALDVCILPSVKEKGLEEFCYQAIAVRLPRFYTDDYIHFICTEFPESYRHFCIERIGTHEVNR